MRSLRTDDLHTQDIDHCASEIINVFVTRTLLKDAEDGEARKKLEILWRSGMGRIFKSSNL